MFFQLFFIYIIKALVINAASVQKPSCSTGNLQGQCVPFNECDFLRQVHGIYFEDTISEIKNRTSACNFHSLKSICCEYVESYTTSKPMTTLIKLATTTTKIKTTSTTEKIISPSNEVITSHPKYSVFSNIKCGVSTGFRISNGNDSKLQEFPWAARLGYEKLESIEYNCGGSIISEFYVLTAAHCLVYPAIRGQTKLSTVRLGEYDISEEIDCYEDDDEKICADPVQDITVKSYTPHPKFTLRNIQYDIGIVKLSKAADFTKTNVRPICLPFSEESMSLPDKLIVIGWGRTDEGSESYQSIILQKAILPLYDQTTCQRKFSAIKTTIPVTLTESEFCAGGEGKVDACRGDSGGPIQSFGTFNNKPRYVQYGIVSLGVAKCNVEENMPGIYTKVLKYLNWILDNMQ